MIKNQSTLLLCLMMGFLLISQSCKKDDISNSQEPSTTNNSAVDVLLNMNAPTGFDYKTDKLVTLNITVLDPDNTPIKNTGVKILTAAEESGGTVLYTGITDNNGQIKGSIDLPSYISEVVVDPGYAGIIQNATVTISNRSILCTLGGADGYSGNVVPDRTMAQRPTGSTESSDYIFMGTFDDQGKPQYLDPVNASFSKDFLSWCNYTFPEKQNINNRHPEFLNNSAENTIKVIKETDVWFSFISESSSNNNSIAYFTYPTGLAPKTSSEVGSLHIILPNSGMKGSGGALASRNRIKLGRFSAGTSIGFVLVANGWNGKSVVKGDKLFYSNDNLNPEASSNQKRHAVLVYDNINNVFVTGMEDVNRDYKNCDNDFNDILFGVSASDNNALSRTNVSQINKPIDTDGDGIADLYDEFPNNAARAYSKASPGPNTFGTLAFEDNWPYLGDYDMNDLVVEYRYIFINNSQNQTVSMEADFVLKAAGSAYHNGFGVEFPFGANNVQSVTGSRVINSDVVTFAANGCEQGQTNAVIIPFDDAFAVMNVNSGYNTFTSVPFITPDTVKMMIQFKTPVDANTLGTAPFNPFIIINKTRGRELHLAGNHPTQKADPKLFKTGQDNSNPSQNIYYKNTANLPWSLSFNTNFNYPEGGKAINAAYTNFIAWAKSNGNSYANWYIDADNMVSSNIYRK